MSARPFRFAISIGGSPSRAELGESIRKAEDAGFAVVTSADHLSPRMAVLPLLATVAEISSLRVSPMVIANDYRHPAVLARDVATIDVLSDGRFELGIGTGWIKHQYEAAGIPYDDPKTRVDRFVEAIEVIRGCWTGGPFTFSGEHYRIQDMECPRPVQQPGPPLLIAGSGRRMLSIAAREADIIGISPLQAGVSTFDDFAPGMATSAERLTTQLQWIEKAAGDRMDDIELSVTVQHFDVDGDHRVKAADLGATWGTGAEDVLGSPHVLLGSADRLVDVIEERRERYGISYFVFGGAHLDDVAPVVSRLSAS